MQATTLAEPVPLQRWSARRLKTTAFGLSLVLSLMLSLEARAFGSFGNRVNDYCTQNARPNPMPYTGDCAICHDANIGNRTPLYSAYQRGDLDAFCPAATNRAPTFGNLSDPSIDENTLLTYPVVAQDPDGDAIRLEAADLPTGADFRDLGGGRGELTWTPSFDQAGSHPVRFIATDDASPAASTTARITISVGNANRPPVLEPIGAQTLAVGAAFELVVRASDPDGDGVSLGHGGLPTGASFDDGGNGTATFRWTPTAADVGATTLLVRATDDAVPMASDSEEVTLAVGATNLPPVLQPIGDRNAPEGDTWAIQLAATDPNGDGLSFSCEGAPGDAQPVVDTPTTATLSGQGAAGNYAIRCSVQDDVVPPAIDFEDFTLTIGTVNRPPVIDPIGMTQQGAMLVVGVTARDPDGDTLTFDVIGAPTTADFYEVGPGAAELAWTPAAGDAPRYDLEFVVEDSGTPPESASARFVLEMPTGGGGDALRLRRARWHERRDALRVGGRAAPGARVEIFDADDGRTLGIATANDEGRFRGRIVVDDGDAPCRVSARTGDAESGPVDVRRAARACGNEDDEPRRRRRERDDEDEEDDDDEDDEDEEDEEEDEEERDDD